MSLIAACSDDESTGDSPFFEGKTIEWIVPFGPGGNDTQSRFMAPILERHIPGNPTIQVVNIGGGGSIPGTNEFAAGREHTGEHVLYSSASTNLNYTMQADGVEFDYKNFKPLMIVPSGRVIYISPDVGIESSEDLANVDETLVYGAQSAEGADALTLIAFDLLGLEINPIFGYDGRDAIQIAFQQGETNIDAQTTPEYLNSVVPQVDAGDAVPLFTSGQLDESGQLIRDPVFPDLPTVGEVYESLHGVPPEGELWDAYLALVAGANSYAKVAWMHGDAPAEAIADMKTGLAGMIEDPDYLEQAAEIIGDYPVQVGENVNTVVENGLVNSSGAVVDAVHEFLEREYDIN